MEDVSAGNSQIAPYFPQEKSSFEHRGEIFTVPKENGT